MSDREMRGSVTNFYRANDGADSKVVMHRASDARTYANVATVKVAIIGDSLATFVDIALAEPKHFHSFVFREPVSLELQNFSLVHRETDDIGAAGKRPPPPPPPPLPHKPVMVSSQEVVVKADQTRTFAASVGPGQYVLVKPSSDIWLCHQHPGGNDWVRADGNHIPASHAPRTGESEGALVIWDGTSPLQSFNSYTETRRLNGPLNLLLGPNDWGVDDNQGAIRVVIEIWNP